MMTAEGFKKAIGWPEEPFFIPEDVKEYFKKRKNWRYPVSPSQYDDLCQLSPTL